MIFKRKDNIPFHYLATVDVEKDLDDTLASLPKIGGVVAAKLLNYFHTYTCECGYKTSDSERKKKPPARFCANCREPLPAYELTDLLVLGHKYYPTPNIVEVLAERPKPSQGVSDE